MGVNLSALVEPQKIELSSLAGKTLAIDAFNTLYQFLSIIRDRFTGEPLRNSKGQVTSHLSGLFYRTLHFLENGIQPVYVFDGKPPEWKRAVSEQRTAIRAEAERKWQEALAEGDVEAVRTYSQAASKMTPDIIQSAKTLLEYMGVPWVQAPSEGEAQAAAMVNAGQAYASGSQDWDSLLFGAKKMVKNLAISGRRKLPGKEKYVEVQPEIIELSAVLQKLELTHDQLILLGLLVGTDYNPVGVRGVGPKTALKLVREHKTLAGLLPHIQWDSPIPIEELLFFFKNPPSSVVDISKPPFQQHKLLTFLCDEHEFSEERLQPAVKKLSELKVRPSLGSFFTK